MGVFVAHGRFREGDVRVDETGGRRGTRADRRRPSVDVAKRVNAKWMTVVPGRYDDGWSGTTRRPTASTTEALLRDLEPHGLVMVLEPLNWWTRSPGPVPAQDSAGVQICRAVEQPVVQDPVRHLSPADHRRESHPQHRPRLGRDRLLPGRRQPGPQRAGHGRDQLPQRLPAPPRQGLHGRGRHGARQLAARARKASRR